ncbi:MAG: tetratricopeptide repeat protein, partial [Alphaproteobacteria bacterium]|nr:tetratricopeptide repeat protein [Alphaproteobacteria bacterium]
MIDRSCPYGSMKLPTALTFQITVPTPTTVLSLEQAAAREANEHGIALAHHGRFFEAAAALEEACEFGSEFADAYSNLGAVLRRLGDVEGAITQFEEAI